MPIFHVTHYYTQAFDQTIEAPTAAEATEIGTKNLDNLPDAAFKAGLGPLEFEDCVVYEEKEAVDATIDQSRLP